MVFLSLLLGADLSVLFNSADINTSIRKSMTHEALHDLAARAYRDRKPPTDAPRRVKTLDAMDHMAMIEIEGNWGIDYAHVARRDGAWKILHVIWQSPRERFADERGSDDA